MASSNMTMPAAYDLACLLSLVLSLAVSSPATGRIIHQPFFPKGSIPPDSCPTPTHKAFFPSYHSPPTPPPPTALSTFPANISSLLFRHPVIAIAVSVSLLSVALLALLALFIYYSNKYTTPPHKVSRSDSLRLYPPNTLGPMLLPVISLPHHPPASIFSTWAPWSIHDKLVWAPLPHHIENWARPNSNRSRHCPVTETGPLAKMMKKRSSTLQEGLQAADPVL